MRRFTESNNFQEGGIAMFQPKLKVIVLEALFILTCFRKVAARSLKNGNFSNQENNNTALQGAPELPQWNDFSYQKNFQFSSEDLKAGMRAWNRTLFNASRTCSKRDTNGDIGKNLTIYFAAFEHEGMVDCEVDYFLTFETLHPVLVRTKSGHLVDIAGMTILELWPLLVLCFSCAALSGIIVWLLVSINSQTTLFFYQKRAAFV